MSDPPLDPFEIQLSAMLSEAVDDVSAPPGLASKVQHGIEAVDSAGLLEEVDEIAAPEGQVLGWGAKLSATIRTPVGQTVAIAAVAAVAVLAYVTLDPPKRRRLRG